MAGSNGSESLNSISAVTEVTPLLFRLNSDVNVNGRSAFLIDSLTSPNRIVERNYSTDRAAVNPAVNEASASIGDGDREQKHPCNEIIKENHKSSVSGKVSGATECKPRSLTSSEHRSNSRFRHCPHYGEVCGFLWHWILRFKTSYFIIITQVLLLGLPVAAGFMGAKYIDQCPMSKEIPMLLMMLGFMGIIVIFARIAQVMYARNRVSPIMNNATLIVMVATTAFLLLFAVELLAFFMKSPNPDHTSNDYCHPEFYKFTFWINIMTIIILCLVLVRYVPAFFARHMERFPEVYAPIE